MQELIENIKKTLGKEPHQLNEVLAHFENRTYKRNEILLMEGQVCKKIYFVKKGWLHITKNDKMLNEKTIDIVLQDEWFTDLEGFKAQTPSNICIKTNEETEVCVIDRNSFIKLMEQVPHFAETYAKIIEEKYTESMSRLIAFNTMGSKEKIAWIMNHRPTLEMYIPDYIIASYLGISKETYSRQKKNGIH